MDPLEDCTEIAHRPDPETAAKTNVRAFMREYGIDDYDELIDRTCYGIDGVAESGVEWFWDEIVDYLGVEFDEPYDAVRDDADGPQFSEWYVGGKLNVAHNVCDRHAAPESPNRDRVAVVWEGEPGDVRELTFHELARASDRVAAYLTSVGTDPGDTVGLYMPMVPEVVPILYGCFKVGAIAVPIFSGFGTEATATRIADAEPSVLFTADGFHRRGSPVTLKETADAAIEEAGHVEHVVVYDRLGRTPAAEPTAGTTGPEAGNAAEPSAVSWTDGRDETWAAAIDSQPVGYGSDSFPADQESLLLYSSGTTGEPKGIVHTHAGVLLQCSKEIHFGFDHQPSDRFFWVSDIGWMMGPWTLIGNHAFGGTVVLYEGAPDHPEPDRFWELIERHGVTTFGVSPTAIRALRKHGDEWVDAHDLSSLRLLGSTGEPWDPESWRWFHETVGNGECPIINISGGTEICGCFLMPMPDRPLKPCTLGGPGLGMCVDVVDEAGESVREAGERGYLVARDSCPSMTKSLWSGDERYLEEYWSRWEGLWNHGDFAQVDADGFWFLHGRADDALNVAGRKVGPAEIEGVLVEHPAVTQAAAIGVPDETTGTAVVCYVILDPEVEPTEDLRSELRTLVGEQHGKPFRPRAIRFVPEFPKTQSGKVVRRAIAAAHRGEDPGDRSSIENPEAIARIRELQ
ncbi:AMP-binding protein [haloarchaeon 3A1-DGR]|nr:AMP-binding protein [haloarchaeon 3A1-DGR]